VAEDDEDAAVPGARPEAQGDSGGVGTHIPAAFLDITQNRQLSHQCICSHGRGLVGSTHALISLHSYQTKC